MTGTEYAIDGGNVPTAEGMSLPCWPRAVTQTFHCRVLMARDRGGSDGTNARVQSSPCGGTWGQVHGWFAMTEEIDERSGSGAGRAGRRPGDYYRKGPERVATRDQRTGSSAPLLEMRARQPVLKSSRGYDARYGN